MNSLAAVLCALLLIVGSSPAVAQTASVISEEDQREAAQRLEQGIAAYAAENFDEARVLLEQAYRAGLQDRAARRYLALTYYQLQQFAEARPLLEQTIAADPDDNEARYALAEAQLLLDDANAALQQAKMLAERDFSPRVSLLLGRIHSRLGQQGEAIAILEGALDESDPKLYQAVSLELAPLYNIRGKNQQARDLTERAIALAPDSFDAYELRALSQRLQQVQAVAQPVELSLGYRLEYDSNVPLAPDDENLALNIDDDDDFRHVLFGDLLGRYPLGGNFELLGEAHLTVGLHNDLDEFDFTRQNYVAGLAWNQSDYGVRLPLEFEQVDIDSDRLVQSFAIAPGVYYRLSNDALVYGFARIKDNDFNNADSPEEDRSGTTRSLGMTFHGLFAERRGSLRGILEVGEDDTDGSNWERDEWRLYLYGTYKVTDQVELGLGFEHESNDYDNVNNVFLETRDDTINTVFASAAYKLDDNWEVRLQAVHEEGDSNIDVYDFDRNIFSVGVIWNY